MQVCVLKAKDASEHALLMHINHGNFLVGEKKINPQTQAQFNFCLSVCLIINNRSDVRETEAPPSGIFHQHHRGEMQDDFALHSPFGGVRHSKIKKADNKLYNRFPFLVRFYYCFEETQT